MESHRGKAWVLVPALSPTSWATLAKSLPPLGLSVLKHRLQPWAFLAHNPPVIHVSTSNTCPLRLLSSQSLVIESRKKRRFVAFSSSLPLTSWDRWTPQFLAHVWGSSSGLWSILPMKNHTKKFLVPGLCVGGNPETFSRRETIDLIVDALKIHLCQPGFQSLATWQGSLSPSHSLFLLRNKSKSSHFLCGAINFLFCSCLPAFPFHTLFWRLYDFTLKLPSNVFSSV